MTKNGRRPPKSFGNKFSEHEYLDRNPSIFTLTHNIIICSENSVDSEIRGSENHVYMPTLRKHIRGLCKAQSNQTFFEASPLTRPRSPPPPTHPHTDNTFYPHNAWQTFMVSF